MRTRRTLGRRHRQRGVPTPTAAQGAGRRRTDRPQVKPTRPSPASAARSHGKAGRRADRDQGADAGGHRLLHDLEADPAAHAQARPRLGRVAGQQPGADDLVDRVVPPDVLADHHGSPVVENSPAACSAAGAGEDPLAARAAGPAAGVRRPGRAATPAAGRGVGDASAVVDALRAADAARRRAGRQAACRWRRDRRRRRSQRDRDDVELLLGSQVDVGAVGDRATMRGSRPRAGASRRRARSRGPGCASSPRPGARVRPARPAGSRAAPRWPAGPRGARSASAVISRDPGPDGRAGAPRPHGCSGGRTPGVRRSGGASLVGLVDDPSAQRQIQVVPSPTRASAFVRVSSREGQREEPLGDVGQHPAEHTFVAAGQLGEVPVDVAAR